MRKILIAGLGNPGKKYEHTRHNAGFRVLDALAQQFGGEFKFEKKFNADITQLERVMLAKPQTFMNHSGEAIKLLTSTFHVPRSNFLIVHDEIDLRLGTLRLSQGSGSAGHNGVASVIDEIGQDFARLRVGIENRGQPRIPDTETYVLQNFTSEEEQELQKKIIPEALEEIEKFLTAPEK